MNYFDDSKNVEDYIKMCEGFDGNDHIEELKKHLKLNSSLLELGMGPGIDLDILKKSFKATGSDLSDIFIERYKKLHPESSVMNLDAVKLHTRKKFDCIYSNKVLHHLSRSDLEESITSQTKVLNPGGLIMHTFWKGDKEENLHGMRFVYYTEDKLKSLFQKLFKIIELTSYKEMEEDDSIRVIGKQLS